MSIKVVRSNWLTSTNHAHTDAQVAWSIPALQASVEHGIDSQYWHWCWREVDNLLQAHLSFNCPVTSFWYSLTLLFFFCSYLFSFVFYSRCTQTGNTCIDQYKVDFIGWGHSYNFRGEGKRSLSLSARRSRQMLWSVICVMFWWEAWVLLTSLYICDLRRGRWGFLSAGFPRTLEENCVKNLKCGIGGFFFLILLLFS